jgi:DNA end-binding protein Ku
VLEIMRFASELVDVDELNLPRSDGVRPQELQMAEQLIESLTQPFGPEKYADEYRENLMRVIRAKMKGKKVKLPEPEVPADTQVIDLMARLRQSLDAGRRRRGAVRSSRKAAAAKERTPERRSRRKSA